jgi:hypothetical protein
VAQMRAGVRGRGMHGCWSLSRSGSSTWERWRPLCRPDTDLTTAFTTGAYSQRPSPRPPAFYGLLSRQEPHPIALFRVGPHRFAPVLVGTFGLIRQTVPSHRRAGRHRSRLLRTGSPRSNRSIGGHADRLLRRPRSQSHRCRLLGSSGVEVPDGDLVTGVMGVQGVGESRRRGNTLAVHRSDGVALCELGLLGR